MQHETSPLTLHSLQGGKIGLYHWQPRLPKRLITETDLELGYGNARKTEKGNSSIGLANLVGAGWMLQNVISTRSTVLRTHVTFLICSNPNWDCLLNFEVSGFGCFFHLFSYSCSAQTFFNVSLSIDPFFPVKWVAVSSISIQALCLWIS